MHSGALSHGALLAAAAPRALAGAWTPAGLCSGWLVSSVPRLVSDRRKEKLQSHGAGKLRLPRN